MIRESEHLLTNEDTPCALFGHPEEVQAIAESVGAYVADGSSDSPSSLCDSSQDVEEIPMVE